MSCLRPDAERLRGFGRQVRQHGDDTRHLIVEARLLPVAGERDGIPSGWHSTTSLNFLSFTSFFEPSWEVTRKLTHNGLRSGPRKAVAC